MIRRQGLFLVLAALALPVGGRAAVVYVHPAAPGPAHDGSSWTTAYTDLQSALAAVSAGSEIWVAAATYKPHASDRSVSFALKDGVGIYGGFAGTETLRSQRDPAAHVTTLSGEINSAAGSDNSYHVVTAAAVTASAVLDGFTITGGRADAAAPDNKGAGIYVVSGSPTLASVSIVGNTASDRGGGLRADAGSPSISQCTFQSNSAGSFGGGGLSAGSVGTLRIDRCVFQGNTVGNSTGGGAIHATNGLIVTNSLIVQNAPNAVILVGAGNTFVNCTTTGNSGYGLTLFAPGAATIANSILYGNAIGEIYPLGNAPAISYSDVHASPVGGTGLIDADPLFQNAAAGDYRLASGSPAVDAGSNAAAAGLGADLGGLPRFFDDPLAADSGAGTAPIADIGAYERVPLTVSNPSGQSVCAGAAVSLSVTASGQPMLAYRWRRGGSDLSDSGPITGSATNTLTIDPAGVGNSGSYDVRVTDGLGQTRTSVAATLTVHPVPAAPVLTAPKSVPVGATGVAAGVPLHAGSSYAWTLTGGSITSGQGTHQIAFSAATPGTTMTLSVVETGTGGCVSAQTGWKVLVDFVDVPPGHVFHNAVVDVARNGITTGCAAGKYCPENLVSRDQMAVFILRGKHGGDFVPDDPTGTVFADVSTSTPLARWMELFFQEGITTGCQAPPLPALPLYCPAGTVTRDGMAKFLLLGKYGPSFNPAAATGTVFADVALGTLLAKWMERLKADGITSGCQTPPPPALPSYCPSGTVTRGEMAKFIRITFGLQ